MAFKFTQSHEPTKATRKGTRKEMAVATRTFNKPENVQKNGRQNPIIFRSRFFSPVTCPLLPDGSFLQTWTPKQRWDQVLTSSKHQLPLNIHPPYLCSCGMSMKKENPIYENFTMLPLRPSNGK